MRIDRIETCTTRRACIVRVHTDDGLIGTGQTAPFNADITAMCVHRHIAPHALGHDPLDTRGLMQRVTEREYKFPGTYVWRALCGVDTAMWDLHGRAEGRSVCELLGGRPRPVRVYASSMRRDTTAAEEVDTLMQQVERHGFDAVKFKIGLRQAAGKADDGGRTAALVAGARRALGDDVALLVDANGAYDAPAAIETLPLLDEHGVCHFEEPCPFWEIEATAEVRRAATIDIAGGEQDWDLAQWRRITGLPAVDIAQPDVGYTGGLTRCLEVVKLADAAGLRIVPHSANRSMILIFSLHLMGAIANAGDYVEFGFAPDDWTDALFEPRPQVVNGHLDIPDGPGWGVEVPEAWLNAATREVSAR